MSRLMLNSKKEKAFKTEGLSLVIRLGLEHYIFIANNQSFILQYFIQSTDFTSIELLYSAVTHNSFITLQRY